MPFGRQEASAERPAKHARLANPIHCEWCPALAYSQGKIAPGLFNGCTATRSCPRMAGYLDAQMRERLAYLCKELVKPRTTQDKFVSLALVATQKPIANKGSALNNPFRTLQPEILASIKAMKSDKHPPTPTALIIKDLDFVDSDFGFFVSSFFSPTTFRERVCYHMMGIRLWFSHAISETTMLRFDMDSLGYQQLEEDGLNRSEFVLGRVLSDNEVALRRMERDPAMRGTQELRRLWYVVHQEEAERLGTH